MKKLLTTTAVLTVAMAGAASAQSVLERVLAETAAINSVTGIFANTADNIGGAGSTIAYENAGGDIIGEIDYQAGLDTVLTDRTNDMTIVEQFDANGNSIGYIVVDNGAGAGIAAGAEVSLAVAQAYVQGELDTARTTYEALWTETAIAAFDPGSIDGSINIIASQIDEATADVGGQVQAIQSVTTNFGNFATTVLGAVNTGEIGLGTNQEIEEAIADTSQAVRSVVSQVGTDVNSTVLAMNSALNTMDINGSINVNLDGVNASVATISPDQLDIISEAGSIQLAGLDQLLGNMATTVLGAVNTGTIVSGVDNQVSGTVAGIVGNSATNMFSQ